MTKSRNRRNKTVRRATVATLPRQREVTRLGTALRTLGGLGGSAVGALFGNPVVGAATGKSLGATISKWLGSGDYTVAKNSLVNQVINSPQIPVMHRSGQSIVVRNREFVATVTSSTTFQVGKTFPINPGMAVTFPWLSGIAQRFQEYKFRGIVFHYIPTSGDAISGSNPALGMVAMQTSYRADESPPSSKFEMLNEYWAGESVPSSSFCHPIECDPRENPYNVQYVRSQTTSGMNLLQYDLGTLFLACQGQQVSGAVIGDLWVTYEVELSKPLLSSSIATDAVMGAAQIPMTATSPTLVFSAPVYSTGSITISVSTISNSAIVLSGNLTGTLVVQYTFRTATGSWATKGGGSTFTISNGTVVAPLPGFANQSNLTSGSLSIATITDYRSLVAIDPTMPVSLEFGNTNLTGSLGSLDVLVMRVQ